MLGIWKSQKAARAATDLISPWVDQSRRRHGDIPYEVWRSPYVIGFVGMLVSLIVEDSSERRMGDDAIGLAQMDAWANITGVRDNLIGEEICLLSSNGHPEFLKGCVDAERFMQVLDGSPDPADPDIRDLVSRTDFHSDVVDFEDSASAAAFGQGSYMAAALWKQYFEAAIA